MIPPELMQEKRSVKADEEYRVEIQAIVGNLIEEYRSTILLDDGKSESNTHLSLKSLNSTEEQQVN